MSTLLWYRALIGAVVAVGVATVLYYALRREEFHGPPPPPNLGTCTIVKFHCNGQDLLKGPVTLPRGGSLQVDVELLGDEKNIDQMNRANMILNIVDKREITHQSGTMEKTLDGQRLSLMCKTTAPPSIGQLIMRIEASHHHPDRLETLCEGQIVVE